MRDRKFELQNCIEYPASSIEDQVITATSYKKRSAIVQKQEACYQHCLAFKIDHGYHNFTGLYKIFEQPGCFFCHARAGGHPEASSKAAKQILDSRLRGNDKG